MSWSGEASRTVTSANIPPGTVLLSDMADIATDRLIGRDTTGTGVPEALTVGGGLQFTGSGGIGVATAGVSLAMQANVNSKVLLGRLTASAGVQEALTNLQAWGILMAQTAALAGPACSLVGKFSLATPQSTSTFLRYGEATAGSTEMVVPLGWKLLLYSISYGVNGSTIAAGQTSIAKLHVDGSDVSATFGDAPTLTDAINDVSTDATGYPTPYIVDATSAVKVVSVQIVNTATGGSSLGSVVSLWGSLIHL